MTFPILYPLLWGAYSAFGIVFIALIMSVLSYPVCWLGDDERGLFDCREGIYLGLMPFWLPLKVFYNYIVTGIFKIDI